MTDGRHPDLRDDDVLTSELRETLARVEQPPEDWIQRSIQLFALRDLDGELMTLQSDSEQFAGVGLRSDSSRWRSLVFETAAFTVELELSTSGQRSLLGHVYGDHPVQVEVATTDTIVPVPVDEFGRFVVVPAPDGPFRVHAVTADGSRHITPVLSI